MLCYTWETDTLTTGIFLNKGHSLWLGANAKSEQRVWVGLHKTNPPKVYNHAIQNAYPYWVNPKDGARFIVFAQPHEKHLNDARVLVHVSTRGTGKNRNQGFWKIHEGSGETLLAGTQKLEGNTWSEGLVTLSPGAVLRIRPAYSDDDYVVVYGADGVYAETYIWHEARKLLRNEFLLIH